MMVEARKHDDKEPVADNAASDMSRFAEASSKLFAEQAAAMAMMTAYGMSVAAQMTGMMLGALRGPASEDIAADVKPSEPATAPVEQKSVAKVVELRPRAPETKAAVVAEVTKPAKSAAKLAKPVKAKTTAAPKASAAKPAAKVAPKATPAMVASATDRDDLKTISGIGPRLEQELNARGILRYADVAALSKAAVKKLDGELGLEGRIVKDDWAGQAKALSGGKG
jgi:NADH-quinone oxidoreductase subunit E